jgi:hypothetical protein
LEDRAASMFRMKTEELKVRDHLEELGVDVRIIL